MSIINGNINDFFSKTKLGPLDKALSNILYGLKHTRYIPPIKSSFDVQGFVFFTRPQLNLRTENIKNVRQFYPLLNRNELSLQRYVRVMLDPRLPYQLYVNGKKDTFYSDEILDCPLVDKFNPFIPVLTNTIRTLSGFPDIVVSEWTSPSGVRKEQISMVDGTWEINDVFDIDVTFDNHVGDVLIYLFQTWIQYSALVFEGMLAPYWDFALENEFDYNTRIYRIILDPTWKFVKRIGAIGAAFPINVPTGKFYDYNRDNPYSDQTKEVNIRFKCMGTMYNDDILIKEFNETNAIFNPTYRSFLQGNKDVMVVIPNELIEHVNFRGYPYIDPETYEFKWLLPKSSPTYKNIEKQLEEFEKKKKEKENRDIQNQRPVSKIELIK